ncbi:MAG: hypothetical protein NXI24_21465 [bacterium]|nr:hypothetical protein [bacterium]
MQNIREQLQRYYEYTTDYLKRRFAGSEQNARTAVVGIVGLSALLIGLYFQLGYGHHIRLGVGGIDGSYYYFYLRSLFFDGDLNFSNEVATLPLELRQSNLTPDGRPGNVWSVGPAILWTPFFFIAHAATLLTDGLADGYSQLYRSIIYTANALYATAGLVLLALFLRRQVSARAAFASTVAMLLCTPLTHYVWPFAADSHSLSLFAAALYLYVLDRFGVGIGAGLALGLVFLVRWQDGLYGLLAMAISLQQFSTIVRGRSSVEAQSQSNPRPSQAKSLSVWFLKNILLLLGFFAAISPQMFAWNDLYGSPFTLPQGDGFMRWSDPQILPLLFSTQHGLFSWHPVLLIGTLGLFLHKRRAPALVLASALLLLVQIYVNACVADWFAGWSFGNRRFISMLPIFALGLGAAFDWLAALRSGGRAARFALIALALLAVWNQLFLYQYNLSLIAQADRLTWREMTVDKFRLKAVREAHGATLLASYSIVEGYARPQTAQLLRDAFQKNPYHRYLQWPAGYFCSTGPTDFPDDCEGQLTRWRAAQPQDVMALWSRIAYRHRLAVAATEKNMAADSTARDPMREAISQSLAELKEFEARYAEERQLIAMIEARLKDGLDPAAAPEYAAAMKLRLRLVYTNLAVADNGLDFYYLPQLREALAQ